MKKKLLALTLFAFSIGCKPKVNISQTAETSRNSAIGQAADQNNASSPVAKLKRAFANNTLFDDAKMFYGQAWNCINVYISGGMSQPYQKTFNRTTGDKYWMQGGENGSSITHTLQKDLQNQSLSGTAGAKSDCPINVRPLSLSNGHPAVIIAWDVPSDLATKSALKMEPSILSSKDVMITLTYCRPASVAFDVVGDLNLL